MPKHLVDLGKYNCGNNSPTQTISLCALITFLIVAVHGLYINIVLNYF